MKPPDDNSPAKIRKLRHAIGAGRTRALPQAELAALLGVEQSRVSLWENGKAVPPEEIMTRMRALAFKARDVREDALSLGGHSAEEISDLVYRTKLAVDSTLAAWNFGALTKDEMLSQVLPLLQCQKILLAAARALGAATPSSS